MTQWFNSMDAFRGSMFRIETPSGHGTGFLLFLSDSICGIATADHVVAHAHTWQQPMRIVHHESEGTRFLDSNERAVLTKPRFDLAFLLFPPNDLKLEVPKFELIESGKRMKQGVELGWCGFPAVASSELCFFTGHVSSWLQKEKSYLVDGVAINGVSGGPAFTTENILAGLVSAYVPNRATGEALPGVCVIRDVKPFHEDLKELRSIDEAKEKEAEAAQRASAEGEENAPEEM